MCKWIEKSGGRFSVVATSYIVFDSVKSDTEMYEVKMITDAGRSKTLGRMENIPGRAVVFTRLSGCGRAYGAESIFEKPEDVVLWFLDAKNDLSSYRIGVFPGDGEGSGGNVGPDSVAREHSEDELRGRELILEKELAKLVAEIGDSRRKTE